MASIIVHDSDGELMRSQLASPFIIGRQDRCEIFYPHRGLSRRHLQLESTDNGWVAVDLESTNGTTVNGQKIKRHWLADGDLIVAGPLKIHFFTSDEPPRTIPEREKIADLSAELDSEDSLAGHRSPVPALPIELEVKAASPTPAGYGALLKTLEIKHEGNTRSIAKK